MTHKSDIWSLGVTIHEACTLEKTFDSKEHIAQAIRQKILKQDPESLPQVYSSGLEKLINEMMDKDPKKRPTAKQIIDMEIIQRVMKEYFSFAADNSAATSDPKSTSKETTKGFNDRTTSYMGNVITGNNFLSSIAPQGSS